MNYVISRYRGNIDTIVDGEIVALAETLKEADMLLNQVKHREVTEDFLD